MGGSEPPASCDRTTEPTDAHTFTHIASTRLARPVLNELADTLIDIGDEWREFALATARMIRDRDPLDPPRLADKLRTIANREQAFFRDLRRAA